MLGRQSLGGPLDMILQIIRIRRRCHSSNQTSGNLAMPIAVREKTGVQHAIEILKALLLVGFRLDDALHAGCLASIRLGLGRGSGISGLSTALESFPRRWHPMARLLCLMSLRLYCSARHTRAFALRENVRDSTAELFVNTQLQSGSYQAHNEASGKSWTRYRCQSMKFANIRM